MHESDMDRDVFGEIASGREVRRVGSTNAPAYPAFDHLQSRPASDREGRFSMQGATVRIYRTVSRHEFTKLFFCDFRPE
jgi:hypothetical protein